ncbi:MAG: energy transducer TonB [Enhygromyxa sp.]
MLRAPLLLALALAIVPALGGCRGHAAELPVAGELELCCKAALDDLNFVGCRPAGPCRASESVWIRGPLSCTADDPEQCAGARCCKLDVDPLASPGPVLPSTSTQQQEQEQPAEPPPAAELASIPLDWSPLPKPISVPFLLCPATAERGLTGTVVMQVEVDAEGQVTAVAIHEGFEPECDALAREALLQAEFEPARTPEGQPIPASLRYEYEFALADDEAP